jgi:hypothetical protein
MTPTNNTPPTESDAQQPRFEGLDDAICSRSCIVHGCLNRTDQGTFVGDLCKPCHDYLASGKIGPTTSFLGVLTREKNAIVDALRRLYEAADVYVACQDRATDEQCGLVQPITVADGNELIAAQCEALEILQSAEKQGWVYSANVECIHHETKP